MTIIRRLADTTKELDIAVHTLATYPEMNNPIKMEVSQNSLIPYLIITRKWIGTQFYDYQLLVVIIVILSTIYILNRSIRKYTYKTCFQVGIEECLHIEFEYNKSKYHLKDVIVGKIYFLLVRIKIKHMEIAIIKRETTGSGPNTFHENETIAKWVLH